VASRAQSLVLQDHILRDSGLCGMNLDFDNALDGLHVAIPDFDNALDGLHGAIPDFDVSSFTRKDTVPPKT